MVQIFNFFFLCSFFLPEIVQRLSSVAAILKGNFIKYRILFTLRILFSKWFTIKKGKTEEKKKRATIKEVYEV